MSHTILKRQGRRSLWDRTGGHVPQYFDWRNTITIGTLPLDPAGGLGVSPEPCRQIDAYVKRDKDIFIYDENGVCSQNAGNDCMKRWSC